MVFRAGGGFPGGLSFRHHEAGDRYFRPLRIRVAIVGCSYIYFGRRGLSSNRRGYQYFSDVVDVRQDRCTGPSH